MKYTMISAKLFSDVRLLCAMCKEEDRVTAGAILQSVLVPISYCQSALSLAISSIASVKGGQIICSTSVSVSSEWHENVIVGST